MKFVIDFLDAAQKDLARLKRSEPSSFKKVMLLLTELEQHPKTGTGHPKPLGENRAEQWSRRISQKHRLVYEIQDEIVTVLVLSAYGHYDDK